MDEFGYITEEEAVECATLLGAEFNLRPLALLRYPEALVTATARWHIRGDHSVEALDWLAGLCDFQDVPSELVAERAAVILERDLLPIVDKYAQGWEAYSYRD